VHVLVAKVGHAQARSNGRATRLSLGLRDPYRGLDAQTDRRAPLRPERRASPGTAGRRPLRELAGQVDVVAEQVPCQPWSLAHRGYEDPRNLRGSSDCIALCFLTITHPALGCVTQAARIMRRATRRCVG
jgi:hypothetical protein